MIQTPEIQPELAETLRWLRETADGAGAFVQEQAPLYVNELIVMSRVSLLLCLAGLVLSTLVFVAACWCGHRIEKSPEGTDAQGFLACVFAIVSGAACVVLLIATLINAHSAAQAHFAPRVYIVEHLRGVCP